MALQGGEAPIHAVLLQPARGELAILAPAAASSCGRDKERSNKPQLSNPSAARLRLPAAAFPPRPDLEEQRLPDHRLDRFRAERLGDQEGRASGFAPVSSISGWPVTKITGTSSPAKISFTASTPELPSASWISDKISVGRRLCASFSAS